MGFLYIIKEREFINTGSNVYKIGRTEMTMKERFSGYSKGSQVLHFIEIDVDTRVAEAKWIVLLKQNENIRQCVEYGTEYFEGEFDDIKKLIDEAIIFDETENFFNTNASVYKCPL